MPFPRPRAVHTLALVLAATVACRPEEAPGPRWSPRAGTTLRTRVHQESNQELKQLAIAIDGEPLPPESIGEIGIRIASRSDVVCEDELEEVRPGLVQRFTRRFVELAREDVSSSRGPRGEFTQTTAFASPLDGRQVAFTWNPRERRHEAGSLAAEGEEPLPAERLEGLEAALDLSVFLPAPGAQPGDEWPVSARALAQLVQPAGDLGWVATGGGVSQAFDARRFAENLQGIVHASYLPPEDGDDAGLARIGLSVRVDTRVERDLPPAQDELGMPTHSAIEIGYRLVGELRWDLAEGRARDLDLAGQVFAQSTQSVHGVSGDDVFEQTDRLRFEGTTTIRVEVQEPEVRDEAGAN